MKQQQELLKKIGYFLLSAFGIAAFVIIWHCASVDSMIPSPWAAVQEAFAMLHKKLARYTLIEHILTSLTRITVGFLLATLRGIVLGLVMGWNPLLRAIIKPIFDIFRPVPGLAWIPLFIIWIGINETTNIVIIVAGAFIPVAMNTYHGITNVDPLLVDAGKALGANSSQMLWNVVLPDSVPAIVAGMKTSLGSSWMAVVASEMIVARKGLGFIILSAMENQNFTMVVATMFFIAGGCAIYNYIFTQLERVLCPWEHLKEK